MIWLLAATSEVPLGGNERVMFTHPSTDRAVVIPYVKAQALGTRGVRYQLHPIPHNDPNELVLCIQRAVPVLSEDAVQAAQSAPHGQAGQVRPTTDRDNMGYQELGDEALPLNNDENVYGDVRDGTYTDLTRDGATLREVPREQ